MDKHTKNTRREASRIIRLAERTQGVRPKDAENLDDISGAASQILNMHPEPEPPPISNELLWPIRGDFLKVNIPDQGGPHGHDYRPSSAEVRAGFRWSTLGYLGMPHRDRARLRDMLLEREHTIALVYLNTANDIMLGRWNYWRDLPHLRTCLGELNADGFNVGVLGCDDEDNARIGNPDLIISDWRRTIPDIADLVQMWIPKLEQDEKPHLLPPAQQRRLTRELRAIVGPDAYIATHFTSDHYEHHPEANGILWQFDTWDHEDGEETDRRREAKPHFVTEITSTKQLGPGRSRQWVSPLRQAHADGLDFLAGEWTQLHWDDEDWAIQQAAEMEAAIVRVNRELGISPSQVALLNGVGF